VAEFPPDSVTLSLPPCIFSSLAASRSRCASAIMRRAAAATLKSCGDGSAGAVAARLTRSIFAMVAAGSSSGLTSIETSPPMA
jgi:hypothetical protein